MKKLFLFLSIIFFSNTVYVDYAMNGQLLNNEARQIIQNIEQGCASLKREKAENKQKNKQKINQLKEQVQQLKQFNDKLTNQYLTQKMVEDQWKQYNHILSRENEKLRLHNESNTYTINHLQDQKQNLQNKLQTAIKLLQNAQLRHDTEINALQLALQSITKLTAKNQQLNDTNPKLQSEIDQLKQQQKNKQTQINEKTQQIDQLKRQTQELDDQFQQILQQLQKFSTTLQQLNDDQQQETPQDQIQQNNQNQQTTIIQLITQQLATLKQQIEDQKNKNQDKDQKDNQIQQLKQEKDQLEQNNRDLLDKIQQLLTDQQHTKDISKVNTVVIKDQINKMINNNAKSAVILKIRINSQELIDINYFITANNLMIILIPNAISSQTNLEPAIYNLSTSLDNVAHADAFMSELMRICSTPSDMQITTDVSSPGVAA